ncbi:MAG: hypothetical protein ACI9BW_002640 [Gammaproteobacteria bacterium]|jgi:hypothetical protein
MNLENKLIGYYTTALPGLVFAIVGFSYNAWRLEVSEDNSNIRTASFAVLTELAQLEQLIYATHYDKNIEHATPRDGWVKVGLIVDLSMLIGEPVERKAVILKTVWREDWASIADERIAVDDLVNAIDGVRGEIKTQLKMLQ